ncbi:hypothetical protein SDC9_104429 [bioreactor metagenome]|uniref:Uncharacterized protein n=1 Tax=bioreactor metagenome TaxID=1076179 RepID=A0A645AWS3_9ZZZZ
MPMQVRHHVAKRRQIDLGGRKHVTHRALHNGHRLHAQVAIRIGEVGQLGHVRIPDHAVEGRKASLFRADQAQLVATPDERAAVLLAQNTGRRRRHTSTRSIPPSLARLTYSGIQFSPRISRAISTTM